MHYNESGVTVNPTHDEVFYRRCIPHGLSGEYIFTRARTAKNISGPLHTLVGTVAPLKVLFSCRRHGSKSRGMHSVTDSNTELDALENDDRLRFRWHLLSHLTIPRAGTPQRRTT